MLEKKFVKTFFETWRNHKLGRFSSPQTVFVSYGHDLFYVCIWQI